MQIKFEGHAWAHQEVNLNDILSGKKAPTTTTNKWEDFTGYTYLGPCVISVECAPVDDVVTAHVEELKRSLQHVRADNQRRENAILDQISKLQALTYVEA